MQFSLYELTHRAFEFWILWWSFSVALKGCIPLVTKLNWCLHMDIYHPRMLREQADICYFRQLNLTFTAQTQFTLCAVFLERQPHTVRQTFSQASSQVKPIGWHKYFEAFQQCHQKKGSKLSSGCFLLMKQILQVLMVPSITQCHMNHAVKRTERKALISPV